MLVIKNILSEDEGKVINYSKISDFLKSDITSRVSQFFKMIFFILFNY